MGSRLRAAALAVALIGGTAVPVTIAAPVASAHSVLIEVEPDDGATLDATPERVILTFNEDINPSFATVAVTATDRTNRVQGDEVVDGAMVTAELGPLDDGGYTVGYRVTSADGHVIQGSTQFTVGSAGAPGAAGPEDATSQTGSAASDSAASDVVTDDAATDQSATDESASVGADAALWIVAGLAVLILGAAVLLLRRGRGD